MNAAVMHEGAPSAKEKACEYCGGIFTPRKHWQRFCEDKCRDGFHAIERRKDAIRDRALDLYDALVSARELIRDKDVEHVWVNYPTEPAVTLGQRIDQALAGLKPPVPPEKVKA